MFRRRHEMFFVAHLLMALVERGATQAYSVPLAHRRLSSVPHFEG